MSIDYLKLVDPKNGDTLWQDVIAKEMYQVSSAFKILEDGESLPPGQTKSTRHLIFDVKMDFIRKAIWAKYDHHTLDPENSSCAGVVSRESIQIELTTTALYEVYVMADDIKNEYLKAPSSDKHFIICGLEFGLEHQVKQ